MGKYLKQFPLIADDEPVISRPRLMALYDNEDLIVNIRGEYQDKNYLEQSQEVSAPSVTRPGYFQTDRMGLDRIKQKAREDIRKKRQALVVPDPKLVSKSHDASSRYHQTWSRPSKDFAADKVAPVQSDLFELFEPEQSTASRSLPQRSSQSLKAKDVEEGSWRTYAKALEQTDYILVELPKTYRQPSNPSTKQAHKQDFSFLKQSQIYNQHNRNRREQQFAQELNLSGFDEKN